MKSIEQTCCLQIGIGDRVMLKEDKREGKLVDIKLSPNGMENKNIVAILYVAMDSGSIMSATSNRFEPIPKVEYREFYPSVHLNHISD